MEDQELLNIWKSYDEQLNQVLILNKQLTMELTQDKLYKTINKMRRPKKMALFIGIPYLLFLYFLTFIGYQAGWIFVTVGFGAIALIMTFVICLYFYHLILINGINNSEHVIEVQEKLGSLKLSSFNCTRIAIFQLPFWSLCWMSMDVLRNSMILYGGINLLIFLGLAYFTYWLNKHLDIQNLDSTINKFFFSGIEWEPIIKSSKILEQLKEYKS